MAVTRTIGARRLSVVDKQGTDFPLLVMYPSLDPSATVSIGPYQLDVAEDGCIEPGRFPLVLISHGSGGTHLGYRDLAGRLALAGYVVLMPEHPGNNRNDNSLADTTEILSSRPRHLSLVIDQIVEAADFSCSADGSSVVVIGHSMGGYTGLALAGGVPVTTQGQPVAVQADNRVKALILLAPATPWFMAAGALEAVQVPILMLTADQDPHTPPWQAELVRNGLPASTELIHRVIEGAGHFSFMSPFPPMMRNPGFAPGNDPDGFDRVAFQEILADEVCVFLDQLQQRTL